MSRETTRTTRRARTGTVEFSGRRRAAPTVRRVYGLLPPQRQRTGAAALRLELERLEAKGRPA